MLIGNMAVAKAKLDVCQEQLVLDEDRRMQRVLTFWDVDEEAQALEKSQSLSKRPERTVLALGWTKKGAELLISYWTGLAAAARLHGDWDEPQRRMAYDLLGVREELRSACTLVPEGGDKMALAALAERQIETLQDRIAETLDDDHIRRQALAQQGLGLPDDADSRKLKRNASLARSDYNKALGMLQKGRAEEKVAAAADADCNDRPVRPQPTKVGDDYLVQRFGAMDGVSRDGGDEPSDDGEDDTGSEAPCESDSECPGVTPETEEATTTESVPPNGAATPEAASAPPPTDATRPLSGRARKERERRERARAKADKRAARMAVRAGR
jgi:hypothetical protein